MDYRKPRALMFEVISDRLRRETETELYHALPRIALLMLLLGLFVVSLVQAVFG